MSGYYNNRQQFKSAFYNGQFIFKGYLNNNIIHDSDFVTLTVNTTPADAIVTFFDYGFGQVNGHSIIVKKGTSLRYTANKDNYFMYTSPVYTVNSTQAISVTLSEQYTCTINPTPSDATVVLDAGDPQYVQVGNTIRVPYGTLVNYTVSKTGYTTSTGFIAVTNNEPTSIVLTNLVTLTVEPTPSDALVTITSANPDYTQSGNSIVVPSGTSVTYTVSKQYYNSVTETTTVVNTRSVPIQLTTEYYIPSVNEVIVNLTGSSKKDDNTVYAPGIYKVELAPGRYYDPIMEEYPALAEDFVSNMNHTETITQPFKIRAYCGSNGSASGVGTNPYEGEFKVNSITTNSRVAGVDVTHIFGAGGGNCYWGSGGLDNTFRGGGPNCLGNGATYRIASLLSSGFTGGAGSCCHLIPVDGIFGTDYIRAYHAAPKGCGGSGSAYGGGGSGPGPASGNANTWWTRGGNSPYGTGATAQLSAGTGIGAGGKKIHGTPSGGYEADHYIDAGAYFNGTEWIDEPGVLDLNLPSSYIKITYLGQP